MRIKRNPENKGINNIIILGLISCFADISSEMVYPLIPLYLTAAFGATPALIGIIEGVAESVASLLKVFSGYISDRFQHKKAIAFCGYSTGVIYKLALILAGSWAGILAARVIDRFGKGIRTAPRDVMVSESAEKDKMGKAFGLHKMLDMAGSATGIFLAFILMKSTGDNGYKTIFAVSVIPIVIALMLFFFVHEKNDRRKASAKTTNDTASESPAEAVHSKLPSKTPIKSVTGAFAEESFLNKLAQIDNRLKLYLLVTFLFTLGNSSNSFLLLKAGDAGFSSSDTVLLYFIYNITASILAIPCGSLSDKFGRKHLLVCGYITFSLVYFGFAFCSSRPFMVLIFVVYGIYTAMTAGVERAFIAEIAPASLKGTMLGLHSTLAGIALLPASVIAGLLWDNIGAAAPFICGGLLSLISALILAIGLRKPPMAS